MGRAVSGTAEETSPRPRTQHRREKVKKVIVIYIMPTKITIPFNLLSTA